MASPQLLLSVSEESIYPPSHSQSYSASPRNTKPWLPHAMELAIQLLSNHNTAWQLLARMYLCTSPTCAYNPAFQECASSAFRVQWTCVCDPLRPLVVDSTYYFFSIAQLPSCSIVGSVPSTQKNLPSSRHPFPCHQRCILLASGKSAIHASLGCAQDPGSRDPEQI